MQQEELLTELEKLLAISEDELMQLQQKKTSETNGEQVWKTRIRRKAITKDDPLVTRIKELETTCKQKVWMQVVLQAKLM